jgi:iron(III) transport system permease protein
VFAFLLARTDMRFGRFVRVALYGNMMVSPFVIAAAWVTLASPRAGLLNYLPLTLGDTNWVDVYTFAGLIFVIVSHLAPFVVAFLQPGFANFDTQREEAASVAGASTWTIVRTVSLPLARPAIMSVAITVFVLGIEMFSIPSVIAANNGINLLAVDIFRDLQFTPSRWQDSAVIGVVLIAIVSVCLMVQRRVVGDARRYVAISGKGNNPTPLALAAMRNPISYLALLYVALTCLLPLAALVFTAFSRYSAGLKLDASILTVDNFSTVLRSPPLTAAVLNSAKVGVSGAVILVVLALLTSVVAHGARPGRRAAAWLDPLARLPIALPGIVLGIGLLWAYFLVPLPIYGTLAILVIAAVTKFLPIVYAAVSAAYIQVGSELREA